MSSKKKLFIMGFFLILLVILSIIYFLLPKIEMRINGNKIINLEIGEEYIEYGANSYLKSISKNEKLNVEISGDVNTDKIGQYVITYKSSTSNLERKMIRIVNVVDNIKPVINLKKEVIGCKKNKLIEYDLEAIDNYDGDITNNVKYTIKNDEITFKISDSSNNKSELIQRINYIDDDSPTIKLNNSKNIYLAIGTNYEEYGATAYDACDGNITSNIKIEHNIDTNTPGIYEVNYTVSDSAKKITKEKRFVTVLEDKNMQSDYKVEDKATIYLTFDDGPGPYTDELLKILDEYKIKATFFVTGQFPEYQYLINEEYKRGHAIGIHTYTHKWSIYESVDSYLKDFRQIENIIYKETGTYTKIFRFPGGSSNTISKNYSKGIVTKIANMMEQLDYTYYDWTFDSGDTNKKDSSIQAIINNFKTNLKGDGDYIVLMHDIKKNTVDALPEILKFALANGYEFDKITENTPITHFKISN